MINTHLSTLLGDFGFNEKEAGIYISTLELGQATILEISRHSRIKRSTVYELVPELEAKGLLKRTKQGKRYKYLAENPKTISGVLKEREKRFAEALPQFMTLFNAREHRPKVFFYEGATEVQAMYEDTLKESQPIMNYTSIIDLYSSLSRKWVDNYIRRRIEKGIPTRIIALDSPEAREWQRSAKDSLREIKLVPRGPYNFSADVHIYGNKVIITTFKSGPFGLLIEDENIAQMQKMTFELMWK